MKRMNLDYRHNARLSYAFGDVTAERDSTVRYLFGTRRVEILLPLL